MFLCRPIYRYYNRCPHTPTSPPCLFWFCRRDVTIDDSLIGDDKWPACIVQLGSAETYKILGENGCITLDGVDDVKQFQNVQKAFDTIGMDKDTQMQVWSGNRDQVDTGCCTPKQVAHHDRLHMQYSRKPAPQLSQGKYPTNKGNLDRHSSSPGGTPASLGGRGSGGKRDSRGNYSSCVVNPVSRLIHVYRVTPVCHPVWRSGGPRCPCLWGYLPWEGCGAGLRENRFVVDRGVPPVLVHAAACRQEGSLPAARRFSATSSIWGSVSCSQRLSCCHPSRSQPLQVGRCKGVI